MILFAIMPAYQDLLVHKDSHWLEIFGRSEWTPLYNIDIGPKKYGSVYQIQLGNIPIVVVNSAASAKAIFGQNPQALSSRP